MIRYPSLDITCGSLTRKILTATIKVPIDYIFIDDENQLRSKTETLDYIPKSIDDIPSLVLFPDDDHTDSNRDFFKTRQQYKPIAMYDDPFRVSDKGKLVLCEMASRRECKKIMDHYASLEPWFGMEQEYVLFDPKTDRPLGWPKHGVPESQVSDLQ